MRFAGLPRTVAPVATLDSTTEPDPTVASLPTVIPCKMIDPEPIKTLLPILEKPPSCDPGFI